MSNEDAGEKANPNQSATSEPTKTPREAITGVLIDRLLGHLRGGYFSDFFEKNEKWLTQSGLLGLYVAALLGLLSSIIIPIRYEMSFGACITTGIVWFLVCIVAHYTAWKFLPVLKTIIQNTPTKLSSKAFLDSLALLVGIAGVISLLGGVYLWIKTSSVGSFIAGIFIFVFCEYMLSLCLNPRSLNIEISEQTSAGEEFIGLVSFFMKSLLKLVPIIFGSGIILGIIRLLELLFRKFEYQGEIVVTASASATLLSAALLPFVAYFIFLFYYFLIDIAMAILSIPPKLDRLDRKP